MTTLLVSICNPDTIKADYYSNLNTFMRIKYPFPLSASQIKLFRGPCLGECPVYEVIILGTGDVTYNGQMFVKEESERYDRVNAFEVLELFIFAVEIGFFEFNAEYNTGDQIMIGDNMTVTLSSMSITDRPYCEITITTGKQTKKVHNYLGAPKRLRQLENKIEKLANTKRWIK